jgi:molecular chaperone GrpE (heat shock protein)
MRRLPTNLTKLSDLEKRMAEEAEALAKKRSALVRQRERLERQAQTARYIAVGKLVEQVGLPITDLGALETLLKALASGSQPMPPKNPLSTTANETFAPSEPEAE